MSQNQHIHDAQDDAMPCQCPACSSPFIARGKAHSVATIRLDKPAACGRTDQIAANLDHGFGRTDEVLS